MQKVYIVLTHTGTLLSNLIKLYTKNDYSHVSLAFDQELNEMYSFGRLYTYNAFIGGFVREYLNKGTFKRFKKTITSVYELEITDEQYYSMKSFVLSMYKRRKEYKFNFVGLVAVALHMKIQRRRAFYCAEFVKYAMKKAQIRNNLPDIVKPEDFLNLENIRLEYKGALKQYKVEELPTLNVANL